MQLPCNFYIEKIIVCELCYMSFRNEKKKIISTNPTMKRENGSDFSHREHVYVETVEDFVY